MASSAPGNASYPPPPPNRHLTPRNHGHDPLKPATLLEPIQASTHTARPDSGSSGSDMQASRLSGAQSRHARSMSNPFPSLFNNKKRRDSAGPPGFEQETPSCSSSRSPKGHTRRGAGGSKDFATGHCMTCASLVKWPPELNVFRCAICSTTNDLLPPENEAEKSWDSTLDTSRDPPSSSHRGMPYVRRKLAQAHHIHLGSPISVQHSRLLIKQCLRSFLITRLLPRSSPDSEPPKGHAPRPQAATSWSNSKSTRCQDHHRSGQSPPVYEPKYIFDQEPTLRPRSRPANQDNQTNRPNSQSSKPSLRPSPTTISFHQRDSSSSRRDDSKKIFKALADYIAACFGSFECVNSSFMTSSRPPTQHASEFAIRRKPVPAREPPQRQQALDPPKGRRPQDHSLSQLDPKMLLLGDFAENGSWWTGGQEGARSASGNRTEDSNGASASPKSPHLNLQELSEWYSSVVNAAQGWFEIYEELSQDADFVRPTAKALEMLEGELLQAQTQLQRLLLKATEQLLKRPGRPLLAPIHVCFLLILMENPLLHSGFAGFEGLMQPEPGSSPPLANSRPEQSSGPRTGPLSGQHSGIVKRIVGLLSNSSTECHNHLISWLAKLPATRFVRIKYLVSGFLTYRLLRQNVKTRPARVDITAGLIPEMQVGRSAGAYLHDEIGVGSTKKQRESEGKMDFADDWQIKAAARVLALLFAANNLHGGRHGDGLAQSLYSRDGVRTNGQLLPTSDFYSLVLDGADLVGDFENWESKRTKFSLCQYPFLLSIGAKTKILEYDARRQMQNKARDAFFDSIMTRRNIKQYLSLDVRRDCLVDDSLKAVGEVIGSGGEDVKKALRITFRGEEGIDGGGLRKEWFLLLVREVFNPDHGMFLYDEDSQYCYFNPNSFETSDQFFFVGVVMGLAIYNSTILDVALPPFAFRKLLASAPAHGAGPSAHPRPTMKYSLDDLAEYRPRLARGLRQLLDFEGDVESTFSLDFTIDSERYGATAQTPLCPKGGQKPVTNSNRREYVDLYVRHVLDSSVARQYEPFKRGFYNVCGGNAFSLFRPEEIELLVRGSDAPLDIDALRAVAEYDNWGSRQPDGNEAVIGWFWESFQSATAADQRSLLSFITGSDRIPAMGAAMLTIKISCLGEDCGRFPIARTCFNLLSLWRYKTREKLEMVLWRAVRESEGFGLK